MIPAIVHTHSDYFDILEVFIKNIKYIDGLDLIFLSDKPISGVKNIVYYDPMTCYTKRWIPLLKKLSDKHKNIIMLHEDFIPYDFINLEKLKNLSHLMYTNSSIDYIRFMRAEPQLETTNFGFNLFKSQHSFAVQASLFNVNFLINYMKYYNTITELELNSYGLLTNGLFWYNNEPKRGIGHYDSNLFPCMSTAVYKGKWHIEYSKELYNLMPKEYYESRGWTR